MATNCFGCKALEKTGKKYSCVLSVYDKVQLLKLKRRVVKNPYSTQKWCTGKREEAR